MTTRIQRYSCTTCARRKVKCNKQSPCAICLKTQSDCIYQAPEQSQRHRKRPADSDLLSRVRHYERLLRENNIAFQSLDNSWISSELQELIPQPHAALPDAHAALDQGGELDITPVKHTSEVGSSSNKATAGMKLQCLWSDLPKQLRESPIEQSKQPVEYANTNGEWSSSRCPTWSPSSLLVPACVDDPSHLLDLHPEPKHILRLWQTFVENVNPLTKIIHVPTLQQNILESSWKLETVSRPFEALLFSVYALSVTSMNANDCIQIFGETKPVLLHRYRSGVARALVAAELHSNRDLQVLQALVLYLLLDPRCNVSVTAVAVATRIGHMMGLHRSSNDAQISFFEQQIRSRLWWAIMDLESRARRKVLGLPSSITDYGDVRTPMNLNDAELHPHMTGTSAVEHTGATEMLYCLMKYELAQYMRSGLTVVPGPTTNPQEVAASFSSEAMARKKRVLDDLTQTYENKYLCYCDRSIPLHHISATVARLTIHRARFWCYHPRNRADGGRQMSSTDQDAVFESCVRVLQLDYDLRATSFSFHLIEHQQLGKRKVELLIYMISELRQRVSGSLVREAWALVPKVFEEDLQLLQDGSKLGGLVADLTLEAWDARKKSIDAETEPEPQFVGVLRRRRGAGSEDVLEAAVEDLLSSEGYQITSMSNTALDWISWDELV